MIAVSPEASKAIKAFFEEKKLDSALRVTLAGGCGGPALRLVLDEAKDTDGSVAVDGLTYLIDKDLSLQCGQVRVDYVDNGHQQGFALSAANPLPGAGEGCSCGSSCSC